MNKFFISAFLFLMAFPVFSQQGEIREKKNIGLSSGIGIGIGAQLLNTGLIWNLNQHVSLGLNVASGRNKYREKTNIIVYEWNKEYDYTDTIGYATLSIFPLKNWPFLFSGYLGRDSGSQGTHQIISTSGEAFSIIETVFNSKPKLTYGGSIGIRYYIENGLFWGMDFGTFIRDRSIDTIYTKYSYSGYLSPSQTFNTPEIYLNTKFAEYLVKNAYSYPEYSKVIVPFFNLYFGISF
jgi:hypothetical protein